MSAESPGSMGLGAPRPPGQGWPAESPTVPDPPKAPDAPDAPATPHEPATPDPFEALDEPDPDWPDDWADDRAGNEAAAPPGMTGPPPAPGWTGGPRRRPRPRPLAVAAVAAAALAIGAGVALAVTKGLSPAPAAANPSSQPSAAAPSFGAPSFGAPGSNGAGGALPGGGTGGTGGTAGTEQIFVGGQVLAVSDTSITIGGPDRKITAAVTGSTRFTGRVDGIQGVKDGDLVTAQITQSRGTATVVALQDPGELP